MINQAVVFYNPYLPELKVSVNGKKLSTYSSIMSCRHQRFEKWCQNILADLYREINSDFELVCVSNDFVCDWLERLAKKNPHCVSFSREPLPIDTNVYERLARLECLGYYDEQEPVYVPIINASSDDSMISAVYEVLEEQGVFENISEDGIEWTECPLANVVMVSCHSSADIPRRFPCAIALCTSDDDYVNVDANVPVYALVMGSETGFIRRQSGVQYFSVDPDDIGTMIVNILEEEVLCPILSDMSYKFPKDQLDILTESEKEDLAMLCQSSYTCDVSIPTEFDIGRVIDLDPKVYPSDLGIDWHVVSTVPSVIEVDGGVLYPRSAGMTEIAIYLGDDPYPTVSETVKVYNRKLIEAINLFPSVVYMPLGSSEQVRVSIVPEDAQNMREIRWESSDPSIADVDAQTGRITANECGRCTITASTRETATRLTVNVQPQMEDIICESSYVEVEAGSRAEWSLRIVPEDAYGAELLNVVSSDTSIAEYRGGAIVGKGVGECRLYISDISGNINREVKVSVRRGRRFW